MFLSISCLACRASCIVKLMKPRAHLLLMTAPRANINRNYAIRRQSHNDIIQFSSRKTRPHPQPLHSKPHGLSQSRHSTPSFRLAINSYPPLVSSFVVAPPPPPPPLRFQSLDRKCGLLNQPTLLCIIPTPHTYTCHNTHNSPKVCVCVCV